MAISLAIVLLPITQAIEFSFDSPGSVELEKEFTVSISSGEEISEDFDVKIFIHESEDEKISREEYVSEIYDEEKESWSDSWYYLIESFPKKGEYKIKASKSEGDKLICARLRKSSDKDSGFEEVCNEIEILESNQETAEEDEEPEEPESTEASQEEGKITQAKDEPRQEIKNISLETEKQEPEKIILTSQKKINQEAVKTPAGTKKRFILYSFVGFIFLLVILLALRRL